MSKISGKTKRIINIVFILLSLLYLVLKIPTILAAFQDMFGVISFYDENEISIEMSALLIMVPVIILVFNSLPLIVGVVIYFLKREEYKK